ncbi:DHH family phosphoesterase [Endozoicomonadaceae bacterium StTr2]
MGRFLAILGFALPVWGLDLFKAIPEQYEHMVWCGHQVPDTDAVVAAIGAAELYGGQAAIAGKLSAETLFVLKTCRVEPPPFLKDVTFKQAGLIDFNQIAQLPDGIRQDQVVAIIDHHETASETINTHGPISIDIRPWGASSTIVADHFFKQGIIPVRETCCALLGGILSDTLTFSKTTTTEYDRNIAAKLAKIADVKDLEEFGHSMLVAKSDLDKLPATDILMTDYKRYVVKGKKVGFGVAETLDAPALLARKDQFLKALANIKANQQVDFIFFSVTDVKRQCANILGVDAEDNKVIQAAFDKSAPGEWVRLPGLTSRKVHLMPRIRQVIEAF